MTGKASTLSVGDLAVHVLGLKALLDEKLALGRPRDRAAAEMLAELLERDRSDES